MLLIGYTTLPETNKTVFLVQNWWKNKPYIQVTFKYLQSKLHHSLGSVTFVDVQENALSIEKCVKAYWVSYDKILVSDTQFDVPECVE
jgi:hypothetical protein